MKRWIALPFLAMLLWACSKTNTPQDYPACWNIYNQSALFVDTTCDKTEAEIKVLSGSGGYETIGESRFCWRIRQQHGWYLNLETVSETLMRSLYERNLGATEAVQIDCVDYQTWFNRKEALVSGILVKYEKPVQGFMPADAPSDGKKIFLYSSGDTTWQRHYSHDIFF